MNRFDMQAISGFHYPAIPAMWPNRATRRAIKQNRESRLSDAWRQALVRTPYLRAYVKAL